MDTPALRTTETKSSDAAKTPPRRFDLTRLLTQRDRLPFGLTAAIATFAVIALLLAMSAGSQKDYLKVAKESFILTITSVEPVLIGYTQYKP